MGRSKQSKGGTKKTADGKHRKETKEERRRRLEAQEEARQECMSFLPAVGGILFAFLVAFALYVRSVPPKTVFDSVKSNQAAAGGPPRPPPVPEFMGINTEKVVKKETADATGAATEDTIEL